MGAEVFGVRMMVKAKTISIPKGVKRHLLIVILVLFLAVVSVDGRPVRLQLCDTAGQVSIMLQLSAGKGNSLLKISK